jgi:hypothetical protein
MVSRTVMSNLADIIGKLAGDLGSPQVVDDIDRVLVHLLSLRHMAADLHGITVPAPVIPAGVVPIRVSGSVPVAQEIQPQGEGHNVATLVHLYRSDPRSPYHKVRSKTKENYDSLIKRILKDCGDAKARNLVTEDFERFYEIWKDGSKVAMAHSLMTMLRQIIHFGASVVEDADCLRASVTLHRMKFEIGAPRVASDRITAEHVLAVRAEAHKEGMHMLALAQAIQWDGKLAQKDVIGEWVPHNEAGTMSEILDGDLKWVRGIRWNQVNDNLVLSHVTSARGEKIVVDLKLCPMVMEELRMMYDRKPHETLTRDMLPATGPIIINEDTGLPYLNYTFRRAWRKAATAAGVPNTVENRDSRLAKGKRSGWQKRVERSSAL